MQFSLDFYRFCKVKRLPRDFRFRRVCDKFQTFFRNRVQERQRIRPKRKLAFLRQSAAVTHIPENGMRDTCHLHADLMRSARMQTNFDKGILALALNYLIIQLGVLCSLFAGRTNIHHIIDGILPQIMAKRTPFRVGRAAKHRKVFLFEIPRL